jgi:hypothetical protein
LTYQLLDIIVRLIFSISESIEQLTDKTDQPTRIHLSGRGRNLFSAVDPFTKFATQTAATIEFCTTDKMKFHN